MRAIGNTTYMTQSDRRQNIATFAGVILALFLSALDQTILNTAVPTISQELRGADRSTWIITSYLLFSALITPVAGRLADAFGVKPMLIAAVSLFTASSLFCATSGFTGAPLMDGMSQLIFWRSIQGIGGGGMLALCFISLAKLFDARERGKYQGVLAAAFVIAALAGPALGGWLADSNLWRTIFYINVPLGVLAVGCVHFFFPSSNRSSQVDRKPIALSAVLNDRLVSISLITVFVSGIAMFGGSLLLAFLLQNTFGMGGAASGVALTPLTIVVAVASVAGGYVLAKTGIYRALVMFALTLMAIGSALLATINSESSVSQVIAYASISGTGLGLLLPVHATVIQNIVQDSVVGFATSLTQFCRMLGGTIGTAIMSAILFVLLKQQDFIFAVSSIFLAYSCTVVVTLLLNLFYEEVPLKKVANRLLTLLAVLLCSQTAAMAEPKYDNQSDVGRELRIPVHMWSDSSVPIKGVVLALPGLVFNGRAYNSMSQHLVKQGFVVYSADMRGYGDWLKPNHGFDGDNLVHYTQTKQDLVNVLTVLRKKFADKPVYCMGESFGANYAVWLASTHPQLMDGVIASGLPYKIVINARPRWILAAFQGFTRPKTPRDLTPYLEPILSEDPAATRERLKNADETLISMSPTDLIKAAITKQWSIKEAGKIPENMPILVIAGAKDRIQKTDKLVEFLPQMGSKKVKFVVLPRKGHLLLEQETPDPEVVELVQTWLEKETAVKVTQDAARAKRAKLKPAVQLI